MSTEQNSREKLVEKARSDYGITNAEALSDTQLKQEMKAIDEQSKPDEAK